MRMRRTLGRAAQHRGLQPTLGMRSPRSGPAAVRATRWRGRRVPQADKTTRPTGSERPPRWSSSSASRRGRLGARFAVARRELLLAELESDVARAPSAWEPWEPQSRGCRGGPQGRIGGGCPRRPRGGRGGGVSRLIGDVHFGRVDLFLTLFLRPRACPWARRVAGGVSVPGHC